MIPASGDRPISHSAPSIGEEEVEAVGRVLRSGGLAQGAEVDAFEAECAEAQGRKHAVAVSSGTAALHLALAALGVEEGHDVAVPSYACAALMTAVGLQRGKTLLCDVDEDYHLAVDTLPEACPTIIVAHLFGGRARLPKAGTVVEDIAQSMGGGTGKATPVAITSFYATKLMTTGEGGMLYTDDQGMADYVRDRRDYDNRDDYVQRFSYKMTDFQAAMGRVQLKRLPGFIEKRRATAQRYEDAFAGLPLRLPRSQGHVYFRYVVASDDRDGLESHLNGRRIEAKRPVYRPAHQYFPGHEGPGSVRLLGDYPGSEAAHRTALSLPIYPSMIDEDIVRVIESVRLFYD